MFKREKPLTPEQTRANEEAAKVLKPGLYYQFSPLVKATGISIKGTWKPCELSFSRGYYIGYRDGQHVFQGKPVVRPSEIPEDQALCFFHVDFIGGASCTTDRNQQPD